MPNNNYDIIDVFNWISNLIKSTLLRIKTKISNFINLAFKYKYLIGSIVVVGLLVQWGYLTKIKPVSYTTTAILEIRGAQTSAIAPKQGIKSFDIFPLIQKLKLVNDTILSQKMNIPVESVKTMIKTEVLYYIDVNKDKIGDFVEKKYKDRLSDSSFRRIEDRLLIKMTVTNPLNIELLQKGIENYLTNSNFAILQNELRHESLKTEIEQYQIEYTKLDSFQRKEFFEYKKQMAISGGSQFSISKEDDNKNIEQYEYIINLSRQITNLEMIIKYQNEPFAWTEDFYIPQKPDSTSPLYYILNLFLLLFIGITIAKRLNKNKASIEA